MVKTSNMRLLRLFRPFWPGCFFCSFAIFATLQNATAQDAATARPAPTPQWRPVYHYTPHKNWTNDPNGLIYLNGEYLLYNQYNPFDYKWGHMSWGHAVSKDLVDWKELPVAIPEIMGTDTTLRFGTRITAAGSALRRRDVWWPFIRLTSRR
jgi:hypothetical protein